MRIGALSHRVTLQSLVEGQDEIGQPSMVWADVAVLWADIRYQSGLEAIRADAPVSMAKVSIQIRKRTGVVPEMRVVDADGVIYRIDSVLPDMVNRDRMNLVCEVIGGSNG